MLNRMIESLERRQFLSASLLDTDPNIHVNEKVDGVKVVANNNGGGTHVKAKVDGVVKVNEKVKL